ncbi:MAG: hypothetical protein QFE16_14210 [Pseudomonadota bacterium]|nr:hypothetical protein [Pseudomonadota bacterium]
MQFPKILFTTSAALITAVGVSTSTFAATTVQIGNSGRTFASAVAQCAINPATGVNSPMVQAGLFNPTQHAEADLRLNGVKLKELEAAAPVADVWLADGSNSVTVALSKKVTDTYVFSVTSGQCNLPTTPGNFYSADGTMEYAASGKSYLTVVPGCALNPSTGLTQPFVNLFDNGSFLLNVSVNGVPLTQMSALRPRALVFLSAGQNVITAVNGGLSTDSFIRDGGTGSCVLP